jgi:hypothetical protein
MTYPIAQKDPDSESTEDLLAEIGAFKTLAVGIVRRYASILAVLRKRGIRHEMFTHPVLRFYRDISEHRLDAETALILGNLHLIKAVLPLPHDEQRAIAMGRLVPVAAIQVDGSIRSDDMPIRIMDSATLKRAFGPEGIRDVWAQSQMIRDQGHVERHGMITVLRDEMLLKVGNQKIKPEDLVGPLAVLGYSLTLARDAKGEAA